MIKNIIKSLVGQASTIIDDVVTTDEERLKLKNEFEKVIQEHEKEMFALEVQDRSSARTMFMDDSFIQKYWLSYLLVLIFLYLTLCSNAL